MYRTMMVLIASILMIGCSSSDSDNETPLNDPETLDVSRLLNGDSEITATSFWQCLSRSGLDEQSYVFSAYTDRTGMASSAGLFTWVPTEETVEVTASSGQFIVIADIVFSDDSSEVSYTEIYSPVESAQTECVRQTL